MNLVKIEQFFTAWYLTNSCLGGFLFLCTCVHLGIRAHRSTPTPTVLHLVSETVTVCSLIQQGWLDRRDLPAPPVLRQQVHAATDAVYVVVVGVSNRFTHQAVSPALLSHRCFLLEDCTRYGGRNYYKNIC